MFSTSKKIGIVSIVYGNNNYGGMLQGYALVKACQLLGYDAKQIAIDISKTTLKKKTANRKSIPKVFRHKFIGLERRANTYIFYNFLRGNQRDQVFSNFFEKYIPHTTKVYTSVNIHETNDLFDTFICGSDVIWQQSEPGRIIELYYLSFVDKAKKKIAYAPSFGKSSIPKDNFDITRNLLSNFDFLSVREKSGKGILSELGFESKIVQDPTILLTKDEWISLCKHGDYYEKKQKYAFAYMLGDVSENRRAITAYCKEQNIELITIPYGINRFQFGEMNFGDRQIMKADPIAWLNLIRNADIFFTDSFHGIAFSSLFNTNYWAFRRNYEKKVDSLNTRLDNITELLGTKDRYIYADDLEYTNTELIDWYDVNKNMEAAALNSKLFLKTALETNF